MQYYCSELKVDSKEVIILGDENHHIVRVKRHKVGDELKLFNGQGVQANGLIRESSKSSSILEIVESNYSEPIVPKINLYISPPKGKAFNLLIEKAVETGVSGIIPVTSERGEKSFVDNKEEKLERLVLEASKQSERAYLPEIYPTMPLDKSFLEKGEQTCLLMDPYRGENNIKSGVLDAKLPAVGVWIGPEGGWSDSEILLARDNQIDICTLPMPVLRVETAVIVCLGLIKTLVDNGL